MPLEVLSGDIDEREEKEKVSFRPGEIRKGGKKKGRSSGVLSKAGKRNPHGMTLGTRGEGKEKETRLREEGKKRASSSVRGFHPLAAALGGKERVGVSSRSPEGGEEKEAVAGVCVAAGRKKKGGKWDFPVEKKKDVAVGALHREREKGRTILYLSRRGGRVGGERGKVLRTWSCFGGKGRGRGTF